ncbi:ABC transporter permease [Siminovitchia sp. FSL H7-0308]|uniref:ABC-type transport system involved in multi-copper enzyme maturation permease subunit n=1 Tax=Siminovitchia thermophila TaxID=1245522 RepID=A0ABS2R1Q6_9BACI|nr:ABC transporter permease [Siminovitchia thermophila]MBM7713504.1 ABC-type transport system involved in multi-copper enzyme maturation permease subunit [Siminovitchia thermophila]
MFTLMKLELKKFKLGWYVKGVIIANILIAALLVCIGYVEKLEGNVGISSYDEAFLIAGTLVRATFIIFAAVLITKFIIEEFKNKTTNVLFTYPVPRKKFIVVKLWIIGLLTFITIFISNVFVLVSIIVFDSYFEFIPGTFSTAALGQQLLSMVTFAFAAAGTSLIPLYFGMRKYSVPATIISSILIVSLISSHNPVFSTASIVYIPLFLAVIGIVIAFWSIRNIEKVDMI